MKFMVHKGVHETDIATQVWNSPVNPHVSLPLNERRALCLNSAEWYKLNGTECQIEEQRARFLVESQLRRKSFLKKHNHEIAQQQTQLHYQTLPQCEYMGSKLKHGYTYKPNYPHPTEGPSTSPVFHAEDKRSVPSIYDHLNDRCHQLDGAIRELTEVALDHIKRDNAKFYGSNKTPRVDNSERGNKHQPLNNVIDVTLSLPFQKTKSLPQNIMKLVQSTTDLPQTRFRYQKASQPNPLVSSKPSGYQIAYHKAKEEFKGRHNFDRNGRRKPRVQMSNSASSDGSASSSVYGNFGSSSAYGRMKPNCAGKFPKRHSTSLGEGDILPQISSPSNVPTGGKHVRDQWHQLYEQWSRTDSKSARKEMSRPHTSSFPLLNDVNRMNFQN